MKLHRFIGEFVFSGNHVTIEDSALLHQMCNVLRLKTGELIVLCDGKGTEAECSLEEIGKDKGIFRVLQRRKSVVEVKNKVVLYCSILKKENFDLVVQKATEAGVAEIVPVIFERTVKMGLNDDRLLKIAHEAAEQSGRGIIPVIHSGRYFHETLKSPPDAALKLLFHPGGGVLKGNLTGSSERHILIGPEGGFTHEELETAHAAGWHIVSLGVHVLRAETAAIIAVYLASHE